MTKVVHCKKEPYDIYIGRGSKWGNPWRMGRSMSRDAVIAEYKTWLLQWKKWKEEIIINDPSGNYSNRWIIEHLKELRGKTLGCFCKPMPCHGDILVELCQQI